MSPLLPLLASPASLTPRRAAALARSILSHHPSHRLTLPLHLSCMHHLPNLRSKLFLVAHEMVDHEPDDAISWYAVGLWYFAGKRWEESRRFFGCVACARGFCVPLAGAL